MNISSLFPPHSIPTNRYFEAFSEHCSILSHIDDIELIEAGLIESVSHFEIEPLAIRECIVIQPTA